MAMCHYRLLSVILKETMNSIYDITAIQTDIESAVLRLRPLSRSYLVRLYAHKNYVVLLNSATISCKIAGCSTKFNTVRPMILAPSTIVCSMVGSSMASANSWA